MLLKSRTGERDSHEDDPEEFRATLVEHLDDLRKRITRSLVFLCVGWVIGWFAEPTFYKAITDRVVPAIQHRMPKGTTFELTFTQVTEPFLLLVKLSFMIGLVLAFPFIVAQLWGFVAPGLKSMEKRVVRGVAPVSVLLFALGATFCWIVLPSAFIWFTSYLDGYNGAVLLQDASTIVFFVLKMELAFGAGFQLPLVVYILGKLGLLTPETLMKNWRQATVAIFVISAVVTPSNDPVTMLMMAVPLSLLFIASVYVLKLGDKDRKKPKKRRFARKKNDEEPGE